jgi:hypothetical protein
MASQVVAEDTGKEKLLEELNWLEDPVVSDWCMLGKQLWGVRAL